MDDVVNTTLIHFSCSLSAAFLTGGKDGIFGSSAQVFRPVSHARTIWYDTVPFEMSHHGKG